MATIHRRRFLQGAAGAAAAVALGGPFQGFTALAANANGRDRQINSYALPILKQETLSAQSADIDTVSGATVTTEGYVESLQAALDAAHLS